MEVVPSYYPCLWAPNSGECDINYTRNHAIIAFTSRSHIQFLDLFCLLSVINGYHEAAFAAPSFSWLGTGSSRLGQHKWLYLWPMNIYGVILPIKKSAFFAMFSAKKTKRLSAATIWAGERWFVKKKMHFGRFSLVYQLNSSETASDFEWYSCPLNSVKTRHIFFVFKESSSSISWWACPIWKRP